MKKIFALITLCLCVFCAAAQYKNDNVLFRTIYAEDLCKELAANPERLLLDVRSKGEYSDTSRSVTLNIGHMKNAVNIDISEVDKRLNEIAGYKTKPVFVYCSHSQRSRRVSKMLADSGFTNVINVNGGMTTLRLLGDDKNICDDLLESRLPYKLLSPQQFCTMVKRTGITVIDIRKDSSYNAITLDAKSNARGKFRSALHIGFDELDKKIEMSLAGKPVILIDESGVQSANAAAMLVNKGFKNVSILFNGLDQWNNTNLSDKPCITEWQPTAKFSIISTDDFNAMAKKNPAIHLLDVRTAEEFSNSSKESFRNGGKIRGAVNIPVATLKDQLSSIQQLKSEPVVVYGFSSSPEAYTAAQILAENGFTQVHVLAGGLFSLRWRAANIKGKGELKDWVVDVPEGNL